MKSNIPTHTRLVFPLFFLSLFYSSALFAQDATNASLQTYETLKNLPFDPNRVATVENLTLRRDRGELSLRRGKIYLTKPAAGKVTGAVFIGEGVFKLTAPDAIERKQIRRFLDADSIMHRFSSAYLRFTDDTAEELGRQLDFSPGDVPKAASRLHEKLSKYLLEERHVNLANAIWSSLLNGSNSDFFFAALEYYEQRYNFPSYFFFNYDPHAEDQVTAFQVFPNRVPRAFYMLCAFAASREDEPKIDPEPRRNLIKVHHYKLEVNLERNGQAEVAAELQIGTHLDNLRVLTLSLFSELQVDSVETLAGEPLTFVREEKERQFSVLLNQDMRAADTVALRIRYSGRLFDEIRGTHQLRDNITWYPRHAYLVPATFDVTYRCPEGMQIVSGGVLESEWQEGGRQFSHWVEPQLSDVFAFAFGRFDSTRITYRDSIPIEVYSFKNRRSSVRRRIAADVASSLFFFEQMFGHFPYRALRVVETPGALSNGFPGILFLTSLSFKIELEGPLLALRSHEVSHQWWGNIVGWKTYHDQWLSEAFAEYSGALMNQFLLPDDKRYREAVDGWRTDLLDRGHIGVSIGLRRFGFSKQDLSQSEGLQAGPIWLGQRLATRYPVDYFVNVYEKGAFVLHALRTMLHDYETSSDARFMNLLADFVSRHHGGRATTDDFIAICNEHFGRDMRWFFEQWVYGVDVPTYFYDHRTVQSPEGPYFVQLTVEQHGVKPEFRAAIPVTVSFAETTSTTQLIEMTGRRKSFRLGPFDSCPKNLVFNDNHGVLAWVKSR